jgi:hypothetical protein
VNAKLWLKFWRALVQSSAKNKEVPEAPSVLKKMDGNAQDCSWRRLRWFESVGALQDAGFRVERDPQGFWRVARPLTRRELNPDWYKPKEAEDEELF